MYPKLQAFALTVCALLSVGSTCISLAGAEEPKDEGKPFNFEEASRDVPKPREVYPCVKRDMIPMDLKMNVSLSLCVITVPLSDFEACGTPKIVSKPPPVKGKAKTQRLS